MIHEGHEGTRSRWKLALLSFVSLRVIRELSLVFSVFSVLSVVKTCSPDDIGQRNGIHLSGVIGFDSPVVRDYIFAAVHWGRRAT
jgi:hypothetical protein